MKLILYEPTEEGYVSIDPYDWEYTGRFIEVEEYLQEQPEIEQWQATDDGVGEGGVELTGREYLMEVSRQLKMCGIFETEIVE